MNRIHLRLNFRLAVLASALCFATHGQAGTITGGAPDDVAVFTTSDSSKDIALSPGSPNFSADLTTYSSFIGNVHSIIGYVTGAGGTADVMHVEGPTDTKYADVPFAPYAMVGSRAAGESGNIVYKFVVAPGYQTTDGGTIHAQVYFRGQPSTMGGQAYLGVSGTFQPHTSNLAEIDNSADFKDLLVSSIFTDTPAGYDTYVNNDVSFPIPTGLTEFYVDISDDFGSGRLGIGSLTVNSSLAPVPEPGSIGLLAVGIIGLCRRARR